MGGGRVRFQFAGQRQPKFIPQADPGFFLNGACVATSVMAGSFSNTQIMGHSCLLNLCLGGGGYVDITTITGSTLAPVLTGKCASLFERPQAGYITQKINVVSNVPLPVAP